MADMHRSGWVGRDKFHIDPLAVPEIDAAELGPGLERRTQCIEPKSGLERNIDEARPRHLGFQYPWNIEELLRDQDRELARLDAGVLGEDHRRVGGEIAVIGLARRLD